MADFPIACDMLQADLTAMRLRKAPAPPPPSAMALMRKARALSAPPRAMIQARKAPAPRSRNRALAALLAIQEERGLTLAALARLAGFKAATMRHWLLHDAPPNPENAARLEGALGIPAAWWREPLPRRARHAEP